MLQKNGVLIDTALKTLGPASYLVPGTYLSDCTAMHPRGQSSLSQADDAVFNSNCTGTFYMLFLVLLLYIANYLCTQ
jgi:hypothetical protein